MSTELAVVQPQSTGIAVRSALLEPTNLTELQQLGTLMASSGFFADSRQAAQACVKILAGRELGIPPIASMTGVHIVEGKPSVGANLIAAAMKRAGYTWKVLQQDVKGCRLVIRFRGEELGPSDFVEDDAKRAELLGKNVWKKYPKSMYFSRAITLAARTYAQEVTAGMPAYTAEELGLDNTDEDGAPTVKQNSQQEQAALAEQKIAELKSSPQAHTVTASPTAAGGEGGGAAHPAPESTGDLALDFEKAFRMADRYQRLKLFGDMKSKYQGLLGHDAGEIRYYDMLGGHGVQKSDQFKTLSEGLKCAKAMFADLLALEADSAQEPEPPAADPHEITDADLPEVLRGQ